MTQIPTPPSSARRFLMVHGVQHRRSPEHWLWWLTENLRQRGEQFLYPQFPTPENPSLETWNDLLLAELAQLGDHERIVVCHSLGTALWLHAAQNLPKHLRITRVLLVSPLGDHAFTETNANEEFKVGRIDQSALLSASVDRPHVVASTTDPYAPADPSEWAFELGMTSDVLPAAGHITPADGYGPWPGVLDWCLQNKTPLH